MAYCQIFNPENQFFSAVMADLAKFCRANESTMDTDPHIHALLEGRREVWLRITKFLNLTDQELWKIYGKEYE